MRTDPKLKSTLKRRAEIIQSIRSFFDREGFVEVTTPSLIITPDPATHLDSFETRFHAPDGSDTKLYLPTSPEHHMKRMLAAGMDRIYQLSPFFRNGELSSTHNPDFTGLEWYQVGATMEDTMSWTEQLVFHLIERVFQKTRVKRGGQLLDLVPPYRRMTVREAFLEFAGIEVKGIWSLESLREALDCKSISTDQNDSFDDLVNRVMIEKIDVSLARVGPVFLHGYPLAMAAQARQKMSVPDESERFELYIGGLELCNGYGELTDAKQLRERFKEHIEARQRLGKTVPVLDEAYLMAVESGLPECSGCALGVDRLIMLLCEMGHIEEVMAFPISLELAQS